MKFRNAALLDRDYFGLTKPSWYSVWHSMAPHNCLPDSDTYDWTLGELDTYWANPADIRYDKVGWWYFPTPNTDPNNIDPPRILPGPAPEYPPEECLISELPDGKRAMDNRAAEIIGWKRVRSSNRKRRRRK